MFAALGLIACGDDDAGGEESIAGWVIADGPVSGAQITLLDREGVPIEGATGTSYETGTFSLPVERIPLQFTVVATGGTVNGQAFGGELRSTVRGFNPETNSLVLTAATTLASQYAERTDAEPAEANEAVRHFLGLSDEVDLGSGLRGETPGFGAQAFFAEALANGGVDAFVAQLVGEMAGPDPEGRFFPGAEENFIAMNLAAGVLQWAGYNGTPYVLEFFGIKDRDPTIADLNRQLTQVSAQIDKLDDRVNALADRFECRMSLLDNGASSGNMRERFVLLEEAARRLDLLVNTDPANTREINDQKRRLHAIADAYPLAPANMNEFSMGRSSLGDRGGLRRISDVFSDCSRFMNADKTAELHDGWLFLYVNQLTACNLYMWHEIDGGHLAEAKRVGDQCEGYRARYLAMEPTVIPADAGYVYDIKGNLVWKPVGMSIFGFHAADLSPLPGAFPGRWGAGALLKPNDQTGDDLPAFLRTWRVPTVAEARNAFTGCANDAAANLTCLVKGGWPGFSRNDFAVLIRKIDPWVERLGAPPFLVFYHGQVVLWNGTQFDSGENQQRFNVEMAFVRAPAAQERFLIR